jgi:hypothetical protein
MALDFKVYQQGAKIKTLGTVAQLGGKGSFVKMRNVDVLDKNIYLVITKADGTSDTVPCSGKVTAAVRAGQVKLVDIMHFTVGETHNVDELTGLERIGNVVMLPGTESQSISVDALLAKESKYKPSMELIPEELIAW